jgi:methenyltetrahydrofolate cyclohydrolase
MKRNSIEQFLDGLASEAATPGGGSAAAIIGAMAAGLVSMVCNLTIGKPKYKEHEEELKTVLSKAEDLRHRLTDMVNDDVRAFDTVMGAYGMPKDTDEQKAARSEAIQAALKEATEVPLRCCEAVREVIDLAAIASQKGNLNVLSDAGVAVVAAYAALRSAALNVYTNVKMIKDQSFNEAKLADLDSILSHAESLTNGSYETVKSQIS